jgi:hypothetical protein
VVQQTFRFKKLFSTPKIGKTGVYRCGNGEVFPQGAQEIKGGKGFTAHFKIGCLVSAGRDPGDHRWECQALRELMQAFQSLFKEVFKVEEIRWKLQQRGGYEGVQFKMIIDLAGRECEIADGR